MTKRVGCVLYQEKESPRKCSVCGEVKECRPYGPGGQDICIVCAHNPKYVKEAMIRTADRFRGVTKVVKVVSQNG